MKRIKVPKDQQVTIAFTGVASILQPVLFKNGDSYYCLLGGDPKTGVFGRGNTPKEAVKNWDDQLKEHLSKAGKNDEVVQYINEILRNKASEQENEEAYYKSSKEYDEERAKEVQRFYDQFKPRKR